MSGRYRCQKFNHHFNLLFYPIHHRWSFNFSFYTRFGKNNLDLLHILTYLIPTLNLSLDFLLDFANRLAPNV